MIIEPQSYTFVFFCVRFYTPEIQYAASGKVYYGLWNWKPKTMTSDTHYGTVHIWSNSKQIKLCLNYNEYKCSLKFEVVNRKLMIHRTIKGNDN